MDLAAARAFLADHHRAVLITRRQDGRPQASPVVCALDEPGRLCISTREPAMKVKNLARDPSVSACVFTDDFFGEWVQIDGTADIVRLPEAMDGLVEIYRAVQGEHEDWNAFRAAMERQRRVVVRITLTDAGPDRSG